MRLTVYFLNKEFIPVFLEGFILSLGALLQQQNFISWYLLLGCCYAKLLSVYP